LGIPVRRNNTVIYWLTFGNNSNIAASGVRITETVPANTTFNSALSSAGWSCANGAPAGTVCVLNVGNLPRYNYRVVNFAVRVNANTPRNVNRITNSATIGDDGSRGADPRPTNNSASDSTVLF
jgi:uncharacterized repeat protein (TIGR01451 family)